ncbi:uncharacterized protein BO72DRAFT_137514 [Aspergillus fijiensis CBS 313.89]|uniref:Extracellular membrane protein CFEM domain-containing protein n=1 Tax=Aspergillus fijiensis CBS 313.89 TaxID=1448319 RepID=A0A8G1S073_9EURO|nr:uncharacterized protein BO72DRAFT_137514 [Aspergillus fijiensis CBS 313.89]RAK81987.1 hypothetical protein BO72DRAFT_137514 [Aspergillus fijiensis CBS 313.89]
MSSHNRKSYLRALLALSLSITARCTTTYYINKVADYSSLSQCAVAPLSSVVRDMVSGCGDGGKYTSYSCFCTASSSEFNHIISSGVGSNCGTNSENQVSTALEVFHSYCMFNATATTTTEPVQPASTCTYLLSCPSTVPLNPTNMFPATTTASTLSATTSTTSPAAPAASVTTTPSPVATSTSETASIPSTPSPTQAQTPASKSSTSLSTGSKAAIGVCVPVAAISLAAAAFLLVRKRSRRAQRDHNGMMLDSNAPTPREPHSPTEMRPEMWQRYELPEDAKRKSTHLYELSGDGPSAGR